MKFWPCLLYLLAANGLRAQTISPPRIPTLRSTTLAKQPINFPADCAGKATVFIVGFTEGSRPQATAWGGRLARDYTQAPTVAYYEVADLAAVPRLLRGLVLSKIKESVPELGRPHFFAFTDHEPEWKTAVEYPGVGQSAEGKDDAYLLVADGAGVIRYRTHGALSEAAYTLLRQQIQALAARPATSPGSPAHP